MNKKIINPWTWQDELGYAQATDLNNFDRVVMCSGQISMSPGGELLHTSDMRAQISFALDNLETVLAGAELKLSNVMRMHYYTTDINLFLKESDILNDRLKAANCSPSATLLGVASLAYGAKFEIEATAVV